MFKTFNTLPNYFNLITGINVILNWDNWKFQDLDGFELYKVGIKLFEKYWLTLTNVLSRLERFFYNACWWFFSFLKLLEWYIVLRQLVANSIHWLFVMTRVVYFPWNPLKNVEDGALWKEASLHLVRSSLQQDDVHVQNVQKIKVLPWQNSRLAWHSGIDFMVWQHHGVDLNKQNGFQSWLYLQLVEGVKRLL